MVLQGARQVGKTFLLKEFGQKYYPKVFILDFFAQKNSHKIFEGNIDSKTLWQSLELFFKSKISSENDLIIFDEIQLCENALASLKYLADDYPQAHICAAGSLLGIRYFGTA
ncbi:MAG: hypothetical protein A2381_18665 [Bdellovibrionales bacterium RIFOXYB1_FULL_37_110]|nr:MAG: hypothetical protein A2417_01105 [Bdellovibrionales bacterium RIFOXYC1_FULL_37_79]OFZ59053.1 MAG: hypothetical protein A2381_18665 [Bdellovibrionales bacterium RIFOXYB1_FULL_37_110]OFZ65158.1 MAG: hypothetical protein A2577_04980 [Bdellovibrionales bacterium RIFOXYD1_FULL_36_51]